MPRLKRSDCAGEGIARRRHGRGFSYVDARGEKVSDEQALERIRALTIPPAWEEVWICAEDNGHIQATGIDEAGRKQYRYHERWQERASQRKFESVRRFARALPKLRRAVKRDLELEGMPRERALACAVRLLDRGFFRIGGEEYAEENESYGVATLRRDHVTVSGEEAIFDFPAKSGQRRVQSIRDPDALAAIEAMRRRRRGPEDLLAFKDGRLWHDVRSTDVNDYIQRHAGEEFSAKDFRTWNGTVLAAVALAGDPPQGRPARERAIREAVAEVAELLGNTAAVCRASYIDPRLFDRFRNGQTIAAVRGGEISDRRRGKIEREVLELIG